MILRSVFVGAEAFKISCEKAEIKLTTKTGAPIAKNMFGHLIKLSGGYFSIELFLTEIPGSALVTAKVRRFIGKCSRQKFHQFISYRI